MGQQAFHLQYTNIASLLSQFQLSFFTGSIQRAKLFLCAVQLNSGIGNCLLKSAKRLREGTFFSAGATALISLLLCSNS